MNFAIFNFYVKLNIGTPHMTIYGAKWTGRRKIHRKILFMGQGVYAENIRRLRGEGGVKNPEI